MIRKPFDVRERVQIKFPAQGRTKQSFKAECDINNILAKYKRRAGFDFLSQYGGVIAGDFGDASLAVDYHFAQNRIAEANQMFDAMPSAFRKRFDNDPARLLEFVGNKENYDEAVKMGMIKKPVVPVPVPVNEDKKA